MQTVNLFAGFQGLEDYWFPKVVGQVNDQYVKLAKLRGQLAWHKHDDEDELFHVVRGRLVIQFEGGRDVAIDAGEFFIVPKGVMHNPVADEECWVILIETVTTKHTGDVVTDRTRSIAAQVAHPTRPA